MNLPEISSYEDQAVDTVVTILNNAKFKIGVRQNLIQLAQSRNEFLSKCKVSLNRLEAPLSESCESLIAETIQRKWYLTPTFMFILRYIGSSQDESSQYYYFEAVFSQPTAAFPIPQAQASVFFRVEDKHIKPPEIKGIPQMIFRIEGHSSDHDVRFVALTVDWILAVIKMKINLFKKIEALRLF